MRMLMARRRFSLRYTYNLCGGRRAPECQVHACRAQARMMVLGHRQYAVIAQTRRAAPDHHIAVLQWHAPRRVAALPATPEEHGVYAQRHRYDGRTHVLLVLVLVQAHARLGRITVD